MFLGLKLSRESVDLDSKYSLSDIVVDCDGSTYVRPYIGVEGSE